ncbi:hypothetical protein BKI52_05035 [marine bacterium AO1-C]|nr:hypothetical protein BKI52_05035 [marine bacterium AO1-C]
MYYFRKSFAVPALQKAWLVLICSLSTYNIQAQSTSLQAFKEANGLWGIKNSRGKVIKSPQYQNILVLPPPFKKGWFIVKKNDLWGIMNTKGRYVIEPSLQKIDIFNTKGDLLPVLSNQRWGIINSRGKFIFKPQFQKLNPIEVGFKVQKNQLWGLINIKGKYIVRPKFRRLGDFAEDLVGVDENGLVGFINAKGKYVIQPRFQAAAPFKHGYAIVALNYQLGMINKSGKITVPCAYDDVKFLTPNGDSNFALVSKGKLNGLVNYANGKQILPPKYISIRLITIQQKRFLVVCDQEWRFSLFNAQGKRLIGPYDDMEHLGGNEIAVMRDKKKFVVDTSGKYLRKYTIKDNNQQEKIFMIVEEAAMPIGGYKKLHKFFKDNVIYPKQAKKQQIEGRVFVQFTVNKDGTLSKFRILKGLGYGCDEEAIRLLKASSPWTPAKNSDKSAKKSVKSYPVSFKLPED